jgi:hypothetical protein
MHCLYDLNTSHNRRRFNQYSFLLNRISTGIYQKVFKRERRSIAVNSLILRALQSKYMYGLMKILALLRHDTWKFPFMIEKKNTFFYCFSDAFLLIMPTCIFRYLSICKNVNEMTI